MPHGTQGNVRNGGRGCPLPNGCNVTFISNDIVEAFMCKIPILANSFEGHVGRKSGWRYASEGATDDC